MPKDYRCRRTDHLTLIAVKSEDKISRKKIWDENKDALGRANPNLLYTRITANQPKPSDKVTIPDPEQQEENAQPDQQTEFQKGTSKLKLRLRILRSDFTPIADNTEYALEIIDSDGIPWTDDAAATGWTKDKVTQPAIQNGVIEVEIPPNAVSGTLTVRLKPEDSDPPGDVKKDGGDSGEVRGDVPVTWPLRIGWLNPIGEETPDKGVSGIQQRLRNMRFYDGVVTGRMNAASRTAIKEFQELYKLSKKDGNPGEPGDDTQQTLKNVHDGANLTRPPA